MPPLSLLLSLLPIGAAAAILTHSLTTGKTSLLKTAVVLSLSGSFLAIPLGAYYAAIEFGPELFLRALPMLAGFPLAIICAYRIDGTLKAFPLGNIIILGFFYFLFGMVSMPYFDRLILMIHRDRMIHVRVPALPIGGRVLSTEQTPEVINELIAALTDENRFVRWGAVSAMHSLGADTGPAVAALAKATLDSDPHTTTEALKTLGALGPKSTAAVPILTASLNEIHPAARLAGHRDSSVRVEELDCRYKAETAHTLAKIGLEASPAMGSLTGLLQKNCAADATIEAIIAISTEPVKFLAPFLCDERGMLAQSIRVALSKLSTPEAFRALAGGDASHIPEKCKASSPLPH